MIITCLFILADRTTFIILNLFSLLLLWRFLIAIIVIANMSSSTPKSAKSVVVRGQNVSVTAVPGQKSTTAAAKKRRRRNRQKKNVNTCTDIVPFSMESGRMTQEQGPVMTRLKAECCGMDSNAEGWYFKYLDPAGAVETGRAIGEFSKIPDGLTTFSVDAEIRTITYLSVPGEDVSSELPLDGKVWSLTLISYPMFRTGYIAVANNLDKELGTDVRIRLIQSLNNLVDFREVVNQNAWVPFAEDVEDGWFYQISSLPPTFDLPDPNSGMQRTLTSYRLSYKGITIEHNAPTLIDQGFWIGGNFALDPSVLAQETENTTEVPSWINFRVANVGGAGTAVFVYIPNLPRVPSQTLPALFFNINLIVGSPFIYTLEPGNTWYSTYGNVFAEFGDTVTFSLSELVGPPGSVTLNLISSHIPAVPNILITGTRSFGAFASAKIFMDLPDESERGGTAKAIEWVADTPQQIAANNPKMEQFLMKNSMGAYLVHKKMRKPVFQLTPASSFGPVQFTAPGYDASLNHNDGSGIVDTIDENMSTISCCVRGISHANVLIVKLYQGWEGLTNVNTPFGQFGHTGLPRNDAVMQLVDNINVRTTGIYPANDNFLGAVARFAAGALRKLFASEATGPMLGNLAKSAVEGAVGFAKTKLDRRARFRNLRI